MYLKSLAIVILLSLISCDSSNRLNLDPDVFDVSSSSFINSSSSNYVNSSSSFSSVASSSSSSFAISSSSSFAISSSSSNPSDTNEIIKPSGLLIDDFEDKNGLTETGQPWYTWDDSASGGASEFLTKMGLHSFEIADEGYQSNHALNIDFILDIGTSPHGSFLGLGFITDGIVWLNYTGIQYAYKGSAHTIKLFLSTVTDSNHYFYSVPASTEWTVITIGFDEFTQANWGQKVVFEADKINLFTINFSGTSSNESGSLTIDNMYLLDN